jgi:hypothetical protein
LLTSENLHFDRVLPGTTRIDIMHARAAGANPEPLGQITLLVEFEGALM